MKSMDLFERYLQAVRKYLPTQRQDDIVAELRANLEAQREEREADLGRPLTEGEMIDWLKELGPPVQMAGRYQAPRYLIGPGIFPIYWHILRLVILWLSMGYAISIVARVLIETHGPDWVAGQIAQFPGVLMMAAAWVTAAFLVFEYVSVRYPEKCPDFLAVAPRWSPTSLPPLEKESAPGGKPRTLVTAIAEFVVQFALLVWMLLIPSHPVVVLGPGAGFLEHSPVRLSHIAIVFFWTIVVVGLIQLVWQGFNLTRGAWRIKSRAHHLISKGVSIVPIAILIAAPGHRYLELNPGEAGRLPAGFDFAAINHNLYTGVVLLGIIVVIQFVWDLWKGGPGRGTANLRMVV